MPCHTKGENPTTMCLNDWKQGIAFWGREQNSIASGSFTTKSITTSETISEDSSLTLSWDISILKTQSHFLNMKALSFVLTREWEGLAGAKPLTFINLHFCSNNKIPFLKCKVRMVETLSYLSLVPSVMLAWHISGCSMSICKMNRFQDNTCQ